MTDYDGFYLVPGETAEEIELKFFKAIDSDMGISVDCTDVGDMFHVIFFRHKEGKLVYDEHFEAIFADPVVYANGLAGGKIFGTFMRKTDKSHEWWNNYLKDLGVV